MLAQRTQKLISEVKPDAVLVQTNEDWWNTARLMQYVDSQQEFDHYHKHLDRYQRYYSHNMTNWKNNSRTLLFWARYYAYCALFWAHYKIPSNFNFTRPGLEVKFALEEAEKSGSKIYFMGPEFDQITWQRLMHETRMNITHFLWTKFSYGGHRFYSYENHENKIRLAVTEPSQFAEKCLDQHKVNWYIQTMAIYFPKFKSIFVDKKDQDLFKMIDSCPSKRIVAVVNQWHMEGIEHEWANRYG